MADKPNFLIIWGDDIGYWNISAYSKGVRLRVPKIFNLRTDPFEFADITSNTYWDWLLDHA